MIYLICTPIGNLNDISLRSIEILNSSDLIYAEDTRKAQKIFDKYKIDKKSFFLWDKSAIAPNRGAIKTITSPATELAVPSKAVDVASSRSPAQ